MKASAWEVVGALFLLALVMLMVRPDSYAPAFIKEFGKAMTNIVNYAVSG